MATEPTKTSSTPAKDPGPSIDILVNEKGVACLVTDRKTTKKIDHVAFHKTTSRMAMFFVKEKADEKDNVFPMEHKIVPEIAERLIETGKLGTISIIVLNVETGQPIHHEVVPFKIL